MSEDIVRALPNRCLDPDDLRALDDHAKIEVLAASGTPPFPLAQEVAIQTPSWYYGLAYDRDEGTWSVFERISKSAPDGRSRIQTAVSDRSGDDPITTDRPF